MGLEETVWEGVDWIHLAQNRGSCEHVMDLRVTLSTSTKNFLTS
jgi:hypothetical protein